MFEDKDEDDIRDESGIINFKKFGGLTLSKVRHINEELVKKYVLV